ELLRPSVIEALGYAFTAARLGNAGLAAQAVEHDLDLLFRRMPFAGCTADGLHDPLRRRFRMYGFLSHLHSFMVTASQKSSLPQFAKSVLQALMSDTTTVLSGGPKGAKIQGCSETIWGIRSICPRMEDQYVQE